MKLDTFGKDRARSYDQSNRHLQPVYENLHYLIKVILSDRPHSSRILCVGSGTGTEIIELAEAFPGFSFVAVEPSASMLEVCRDRLKERNLLDRCTLVNGFVRDLPEDAPFDAAICLLVLHHTSKDGAERQDLVAGVSKRLKPGGCFLSAELSYDPRPGQAGDLMETWKSLNRMAGSPEDKVEALPQLMEKHLSIQSPADVEKTLENNGFPRPVQFFQSLLIRAWYAKKG